LKYKTGMDRGMAHILADSRQDGIAELICQTEAVCAERVKALKALIVQLDVLSMAEGDCSFPECIQIAQQLLDLDDLAMSQTLKVSRPTIGRWVRGVSSPHVLARKEICNVLDQAARTKIKCLQG
jgi:hypothetical protein